jgi:hypothetical protein
MREIFASSLFYAGLTLTGAGVLWLIVAVLRHSHWLPAPTFTLAGVVLMLVAWTVPADHSQAGERRTQLDEFMPVYEFNEVHTIQINASREQVYRAILSVTAGEITLFKTLTWIRRFGRQSRESILNAASDAPILDVALQTGFIKLAEEPPKEIVVGTAVAAPANIRLQHKPTPEDFRTVRTPGFALAAMNFLVQESGHNSCTLRTETRVHATDNVTTRRFAKYWRVIYPGSALIRRMWLRAVKRRAEASMKVRTGYSVPKRSSDDGKLNAESCNPIRIEPCPS